MTNRLITGAASSGYQALEIVAGHDSWGDGLGLPTEYPTGIPNIQRDWTDAFDRMLTGSTTLAVGLSGYLINQITAELAGAAASLPNATVSILLAGTNNGWAEQSDATIYAEIEAWIAEVELRFPLVTRHIICTIPPPVKGGGATEQMRQRINYRLLSGELGSTVDVVNLDDLLFNTDDQLSWIPAYEQLRSDDGLPSNHPNAVAADLIYDQIHRVLVNGWAPDPNLGKIGFWTDSEASNMSALNDRTYSAPRADSEIYSVTQDNIELYNMGVFCRSSGGGSNIVLGLFEIDPSTHVIGLPDTIVNTPEESINTYKWNFEDGLHIPLTNGKSYTVAIENQGGSPRIVNTTPLPAVANERTAVDYTGIDAGVAFVENTRTSSAVIWGLVRTYITTPIVSTTIPTQTDSKDVLITPLNLTNYIDGAVSFSAFGLPLGLSIDEGLIYGTPTYDEDITVTIDATGPTGLVTRTTFLWTVGIGGEPHSVGSNLILRNVLRSPLRSVLKSIFEK